MIATCSQPVCVYLLDGSYLETFNNLPESDCRQSESNHNCLEIVCLPPGNLCKPSKVVTQKLRVFHTEHLGHCDCLDLIAECEKIQHNH